MRSLIRRSSATTALLVGSLAIASVAQAGGFAGDACVGKAPGVLGTLPDAVIDDRAALNASLARLAELDFDTLLVCDGHSILSGAQTALRALVAQG